MITIVDYSMGNIQSVAKKCNSLNVKTIVTSKPNEILQAEKIILPGVGHFQKAIENLQSNGVWEALNEVVLVKKVPILGICLGMQVMGKNSEEGNNKINGFGWFDAKVIKFRIKDTLKYKIPHIGWNQVKIEKDNVLFKDVDLQSGFYFVHSYHFQCNNISDVLNTTEYEYNFVSAVQRDNLFGVQYHPEKSHEAGTQLLKNFINI